MKNGYILTFNRKETEYGYPYTKIYNLVEVILDYYENSDFELICQHTIMISDFEIKIHSSEEYYDFNDIVDKQLTNINKTILYYNVDNGFGLYNTTNGELEFIKEKYQSIIKNDLFELLSTNFLCN